MSDNPYRMLDDSAYWRRSVASAGLDVDPVSAEFLRLSPQDRVATAGSCFAQNIARHLRDGGFYFLVTEPAHPVLPPSVAARAGYGIYTARYGNIYTTLQLNQLFDRAYGRFHPEEDFWAGSDGASFVDPFRPTIQPGGFASIEELRADRGFHFCRVREAFETLDVFIFTLGLTECWVSRLDGSAYPLCPGVAGGTYDEARHAFCNLRSHEVTTHLKQFIDNLRSVNPHARVVITVSPVPLIATASGRHVLDATIYSKSVLRVAAQEVVEDRPNVFYFPSYEIITGPQTRGGYFASNLRDVTEAGVTRAMQLFMAHATGGVAGPVAATAHDPAEHHAGYGTADDWVKTMCDETLLDVPDML